MSLFATLFLAFKAMLKNRVRSSLTILGIVIGIASVIAMVAVGQGASALIRAQVTEMGSCLLMVLPGAATSEGVSSGGGTAQTLTFEDGAAIAEEIPTVEAITPFISTKAQLVNGKMNWWARSILGVGTAFPEIRKWEFESGELFTEQDISSVTPVCVLGATVRQNLFGDETGVGKMIRIKSHLFKVVGALSPKGTSALGHDQDDLVLVPWTTAKRLLQKSSFGNVDQLLLTATSESAIDDTTKEIQALLRQRHRLGSEDPDDFRVLTMTEVASALTQTSNIMTILLAVIASISLLVGGIGIMNIMLVSVVERTREIGLRMAVGACGGDILLQFLTEAVALSSLAGAIGIGLGVVVALTISQTLNWPIEFSVTAFGIALVFSGGVGVFFGFAPAFRASQLDPIEALRYE